MKENLANCEEKLIKPGSGMKALVSILLSMVLAIAILTAGAILAYNGEELWGTVLIIVTSVHLFLISPILFLGLKIVKPNEALVLTLFGNYIGTIKEPGFYYVNPFCSAVEPPKAGNINAGQTMAEQSVATVKSGEMTTNIPITKNAFP